MWSRPSPTPRRATPLLIYALVIVLAGDDHAAVRLAAADELQDQRRHLRVPAEAVLRRRRWRTTSGSGPRVPRFIPQQRGRLVVDRCWRCCRRAGRLCPVAHVDAAGEAAVSADPGLAHGAADRLHHPLLPGLPLDGAARHHATASSSSTSPSTSRWSSG